MARRLVRLHRLPRLEAESLYNLSMKLDDLDTRIISAFMEDPQIGVLAASRLLGVARGTVQARLDRMQQRGVLTTFAPQVSPGAMGYPLTALLHTRDPPDPRPRPRRHTLVRHTRGPRGAHDHRLRRPPDPGGRQGQHRPSARDRHGRRRRACDQGVHGHSARDPHQLSDPATGPERRRPTSHLTMAGQARTAATAATTTSGSAHKGLPS